MFGASLQAGAIYGGVHIHDWRNASIAEVFTAAVEQLSSGHPLVRIAGMRLLENLGQEYPGYRQAVMHVLCGCLRAASDHAPSGGDLGVLETAQRVILKHMSQPRRDLRDVFYDMRTRRGGWDDRDEQYWPDVSVDLSGVTLTDFDTSGRWINDVDFSGARFIGSFAKFSHTYFSESPRFDGATFAVPADFTLCYFNRGASFDGVRFVAAATFREAFFTGPFKSDGLSCDGTMDTVGMHFS
ncbi:pentapeptide repeat-containing protein [Lentzea terrae]|uniref:pentapeptide repeat-containing protein n=1 Tax=Lentzea terrae TaxID=2200761 RepID=UPI0013005190|nr:pentapeptide repeat-containing protein [Lentzea terrae]